MNRFWSLVILALLAAPRNVHATEDAERRRTSAANHMAKEFSSLGVHKLYVPDFCDSSLRPIDRGAFFAATFSKLLSKKAKSFAVESRVEAHRFLKENSLTDCDLSRAETLSRFSSQFSVDSVLFVNLTVDKGAYTIDFSLKDLSGKELSRSSYSEPCYSETEAYFPATPAASGWPFYFANLDGVSPPQLVNAPNPDPRVAHGKTGAVVVSALVAANGKLDEIRLVQSMTPEIDNSALDTLKSWKLEPAKDSDGSVIPVRLPFVVSFFQRP